MKKNIIGNAGNMKRIIGITVATIMLFMLAGCGNSGNSASGNTSTQANAGGNTDSQANTNEPQANTSEPVVIYAATGGAPKPFTFVDDNSQLTGHNIELINAIFAKLPQYKLEIEVTDFTSIFAGLDSDKYQIGVNNFAMNEQRKEKYLFTDPIFANEYVAIFAKGNEQAAAIEGWSDLAGLKTITSVGINITTSLESYNENNPDAQIIIEYSEEDLVLQIQDIEAGKYDFVLMDKPMFEYFQKEFNFNVEGRPLSNSLSQDLLPQPYSYLIVSKGHDKLVEDINKAFKEVIDEGISKEINLKWFGSDYTPSN